MIIFIILTAIFISSQVVFGQQMPSANLNNLASVNGTNMSVNYDITGGKLVSINANTTSNSIVISLQTTKNGNFTINLPRTLIDATKNGEETHFVVRGNNHGLGYEETTTPSNRILKIAFNQGIEEIQITGSQMLTQAPLAAGSVAQNFTLSGKPQVLEASFTDTPPIINGKWTTEWDPSKAVSTERNGSKMYVLAQHDSNFLYVLADVVTDQTNSSYAPVLGYHFLMIFDSGNSQGNFLSVNETGVGTSYAFLNGTKMSTNFGSEVWTYDNQSNPIDLVPPSGYNSSMGFSSTNDPIESNYDHRLYEFRIPLSLLHNLDRYGISLKASACSGNNNSACSTFYALSWPSGTTMSIPSSHGVLELMDKTTGTQSEMTLPNNLWLIVGGIISVITILFVIRYKKRQLINN
ncbi:MAG: hypothetical protein KGH89_06320 [Thaumarchaeota archaeon]|nr:hypothetical protein [Nitrososphaerota archaeon]